MFIYDFLSPKTPLLVRFFLAVRICCGCGMAPNSSDIPLRRAKLNGVPANHQNRAFAMPKKPSASDF
jgi:hypothetical protein